jgi:uncharacterized protein (TIGR02117 family)
VPVYVAGHGLHTGLVVRSADVPADAWPARRHFPHAEYLELGWGDREYYMHPAPGPLLALRALLWPTDSALHAVGFSGPIEREFPGAEIVELHVPLPGFARLVEFVRESHAPEPNDLGPGQRPESRFYASLRRFHLFETCNTWVARALAQAGLPVDPAGALTASGLLTQVRRLAARCSGGALCSAP